MSADTAASTLLRDGVVSTRLEAEEAVRIVGEHISVPVWREVLAGRARAHAKHGENSIEAVAGGDPRWLSILVEEVGEVAHEQTYDATGDLRAELVDLLCVASAWVDAIDRQARA